MQYIQWERIGLFLGGWISIAFALSSLLYFSALSLIPTKLFTGKNIFMWQMFIYAWAILFPLVNLFAKDFALTERIGGKYYLFI